MPYKDPEIRRIKSKERQRKYCKKPGVPEAYVERVRKLREDPAYRAKERAQRKACRNNPETRPRVLERDRKFKRKRMSLLNSLKIERGCYDCGGMFPPSALDWDHLPGTEKSFVIARYLTTKPLEQVLAEIAKCQLVCATCHRIRTINRMKEGK